MKLSEIAEELAKLKPEPESDEAGDEATKIEFEKFLMEHPEWTDEMALGTLHELADIEKGIDPATAAARTECRRLGIGDFAPNRPKKPPVAIPETVVDPEEAWLKAVLEKRRAKMAELAAQQPQRRAPMQQLRPWPRGHGLYAALDD